MFIESIWVKFDLCICRIMNSARITSLGQLRRALPTRICRRSKLKMACKSSPNCTQEHYISWFINCSAQTETWISHDSGLSDYPCSECLCLLKTSNLRTSVLKDQYFAPGHCRHCSSRCLSNLLSHKGYLHAQLQTWHQDKHVGMSITWRRRVFVIGHMIARLEDVVGSWLLGSFLETSFRGDETAANCRLTICGVWYQSLSVHVCVLLS